MKTDKRGRPSKPDWIKGKGVEALKIVYEIMNDSAAPLPIRLQACRMMAEYDLGKPRQMVMVDAEVETRRDPLEGMSLKERMEYTRGICQHLVEDGILDRP